MRIPDIEVFGDPSANIPGYWESVSSLIDWCEENYIKNYYIAEYCTKKQIFKSGNTLSNIGYFIIFLNIFIFYKNKEIYSKISMASAFLLTIGSAFYHATLKYEAQMLDEFPMILLIINGFIDSLTYFNIPYLTKLGRKTYVIVFGSSFFLSYLNLVVRSKLIFQVLFGLAANLTVLILFYISIVEKLSKKYIIYGFISGYLGFMCWNIDSHFCEIIRGIRNSLPFGGFLLQGHMWWHLLTALSAYFIFQHRHYARDE